MKQAGPTPTCGGWTSEGYLDCRSPHPQRSENLQLHIGVPQPMVPVQEKKSSQNIVVQSSGDSLGKTEGSWKSRHPLIGPIHRLTHSQALTLGSSGETAAQEMPEIYREKLSCVASEWGLVGQLSLFWALLLCSLQGSTTLLVLNLSPHGQNWIFIGLVRFAHSTLKNPCEPYPTQLTNCLVAILGGYWATSPTPCTQQKKFLWQQSADLGSHT